MKKTIICICFIFIMSGCSKTAEVSENVTDEPIITDDILRVSIYENINWNPHFEENKINREILGFVYEPLFEVDNNMNSAPILAESMEANDTRAIIKLKIGVKFHDGNELTADDVVHSANLVIHGISQYENRGIAAANVIDSSTVEIIFKNKVAFPEKSLNFPIIKNNFSDMPDKPNGTGIFTYLKKSGYDTFSFNVNKNYYDEGTVSFKGLEITAVKTYARMQKLFETGETDIIHIENLSSFRLRPNAGVYYYISDEMVCIWFNTNTVDTDIRKAIYHNIDKKHITDKYFRNVAEYIDIPVEQPEFSYIPPCELNILTENKDEYINLFEEVKNSISGLGINCKIHITDNLYESMNSGMYDAFISTFKTNDDTDINNNFTENIPFIPICFKKGAVSVCSKIKTEPNPTNDFVWMGYKNWKIK